MGRALVAAQLLPSHHQTSARHASLSDGWNLVGSNQAQAAIKKLNWLLPKQPKPESKPYVDGFLPRSSSPPSKPCVLFEIPCRQETAHLQTHVKGCSH